MGFFSGTHLEFLAWKDIFGRLTPMLPSILYFWEFNSHATFYTILPSSSFPLLFWAMHGFLMLLEVLHGVCLPTTLFRVLPSSSTILLPLCTYVGECHWKDMTADWPVSWTQALWGFSSLPLSLEWGSTCLFLSRRLLQGHRLVMVCGVEDTPEPRWGLFIYC